MATANITPALQITPDNDVLTLELFIAAPRERIFQALTDPAQASKWWGRKDHYYFTHFNMDVRPGGKWSTTGTSQKMGDINVHGEFLEVDPPSRLAYTWVSNWMEARTKVLWELDSQSNGTMVKLTHSGFAGSDDQAKGHSFGWTLVFTWLQAFVEKGETVETRA
ncbi:MAG: hypothetical protein AUG89_05460 [Acidobacteria bacterium 13_1_20CM_4_56_7]|nr:MAG: hypothetical protein AUG89_05460 [Acidobacteria bacterium 13_1_20CM_4_56_7]